VKTHNILLTYFHELVLRLFILCLKKIASTKIFDCSLVKSGPRNSFAVVRVKCFVPFAQILEYFTIKWFKTSLDMFVELYQIAS
jgi:hypothetical protein